MAYFCRKTNRFLIPPQKTPSRPIKYKNTGPLTRTVPMSISSLRKVEKHSTTGLSGGVEEADWLQKKQIALGIMDSKKIKWKVGIESKSTTPLVVDTLACGRLSVRKVVHRELSDG